MMSRRSCQDFSVIDSRWLFKIKHVVYGSIEKYEDRFVGRGLSQREGVGYGETFAPVARYTSIKAIMFVASILGWPLY